MYVSINVQFKSEIIGLFGLKLKNTEPPPKKGSKYLLYLSGKYSSNFFISLVFPPTHFKNGLRFSIVIFYYIVK